MQTVLTLPPADLLPSTAAVLSSQGIPTGTPVSERVLGLVQEAGRLFAATARPRALLEEISVPAFARVYASVVADPDATPVGRIFPAAEGLALFALTLGQELSDEIARLFSAQELALAAMLDGLASEAAEMAVTLLERQRSSGSGDAAVLAYSPGYCGWPVTGQRALFASLRPKEVGITLTPSCLMQPLKSVSGVLVSGPPAIHRHDRGYECCAGCASRDCMARFERLGTGIPRAAM